MIVPNSTQDSTARSHEENSELSEFQRFEFCVNGVKRIIKIPLHSTVKPNLGASSKILNVEIDDIDEVNLGNFSADPIVIDPDLKDDGALHLPLSHEQSVVTNFIALDAAGHCESNQSTVPQSNPSNASRDVQVSVNTDSLSTAKASCTWQNTNPVTVKTALANRCLHLSPNLDAATCTNQSITSHLKIRSDNPVKQSYVSNSHPLIRASLVTSTVSKNISQSVEKISHSKVTLIPSQLFKSSYSNTSLNLSDVGSKSLLQTGIPVIRTNSASQPLVKSGNLILPSLSNGSITQWQLNKIASANCSSTVGAVQSGLTEQTARQCSLMLMNRQSHASVLPQTSSGANQGINLSQFVPLNEHCYYPTTSSSSVPVSLDSSSTQVRKVKIRTDISGSCIISVDGLTDRSPALSYADKRTNFNTSNILTTGSVLHSAVPYVLPTGTTFQVMHPNAIQNSQTLLRIMPPNRNKLHYAPSNVGGNHRPLNYESFNILSNDKAVCLKPPMYRASSIPPLLSASPNFGQIGLKPSCVKQTGLSVQSGANGIQEANGPLCVGSVGTLSLCKLPSSMSINMTEPSVKCCSVANSASLNINSSAAHCKFSSFDPSRIPSASLAPACLAWAIPVTGVHMSIPSVKNIINTTRTPHNKLNPQLREFRNHFLAPFQPHVTEFNNVLKPGCLTSAVPGMSQNLVMSQAIVSKSSQTTVSHVTAGISTPSASGVKSVSSFVVSSASETPTFLVPSCGVTVSKSRDSMIACSTSLPLYGAFKAVTTCTWYPPNMSPTSSGMLQNNSSTSETNHLFAPTKELPILSPTVSCCPNENSSHLCLSVSQQHTQPLSTPQVAKSSFSFYNSTFKHLGCKSFQEHNPLSTNFSTNTSARSSQNISNVQADIASPLIPLSVEIYDSSITPANTSKKRKHKSSNSMRRNGSSDTSTSSLSDAINLLSDPESMISSSESWTSDDSVTIGKPQIRRRCRKLPKRKFVENDKYSAHSLENSEVNHRNVELQCFVSLENLYLNGKISVDIHDSENLVCCRCPMPRPISTVYSIRENVSRKKSYKLKSALIYISDTD